MNSSTVFTGNTGLTSVIFGKRTIPATGAMSRMKSYGRSLYSVVLTALGKLSKNSV